MVKLALLCAFQVTNDNASFSTGTALFTYNKGVAVTALNPSTGAASGGTSVLVAGDHFLNTTVAACKFGTKSVPAAFLSSLAMLCVAPSNPSGVVALEVTSNGADFSFSGAPFTYYTVAKVYSIWPLLGSGSEGGTVVTIHGEDFENSAGLSCKFGSITGIEATWLSSTTVLCKTPRHRPGLVVVQVTNNGADFLSTTMEYLYVSDIALEDVWPAEVLDTGQVQIFVKGSNFLNTTTLACRVGTVVVRGTFFTPSLVSCMAPSHSAQPRLQRAHGTFSVEVSVNGLDYTDSGKVIDYVHASPEGHYARHGMSAVSPNGTHCTGVGNLNFTVCEPGTFQPSSGTSGCLRCPVGYICPGTIYSLNFEVASLSVGLKMGK